MIIIIKKIIPLRLKIFLRELLSPLLDYKIRKEIKKIRDNREGILQKVKSKNVHNVIFLVIHDSVWKYEEVYRLMSEDSTFNVNVVVIPLVREREAQMDVYYQSLDYFENQGYCTIASYDGDNKKWLDVKEIIKPDIVFFTNPHKITFEKYYIDNFVDKLTCYTPYTFDITKNFEGQYNQKFHNILFAFFVETRFHYEYAEKFSKVSKAKNVIISGFAGMDRINSDSYKATNVWKDYLGGQAKKIIWAPHHTIPEQGNNLDYSCFLDYAEYFKNLLNTNEDIQIAFKPHPLLKEKLYTNSRWGKRKTDNYYSIWDKLPNGQLEIGNYTDLFYFSDAMILDSASFTVEYLFFDKPSLFTVKDDKLLDRFNSFGKRVFNFLYKAHSVKDIDSFIGDVVFGGEDTLRLDRNRFFRSELLTNNKSSASKIIYDHIKFILKK